MHHSNNDLIARFNKRMEKLAKKEQLGGTGKYPDGKIQESDAGELKFSVGYDEDTALCFMDFGTPVRWFGLMPEDAIDLGRTLIKHGRKALKIKGKPH